MQPRPAACAGLILAAVCAAGGSLYPAASGPAAPAAQIGGFYPVGVRYRTPDDPAAVRRDLEQMQRLRFNIVVLVTSDEPDARSGSAPLLFTDRLLAGAPDPRVTVPLPAAPATIRIVPGADASHVTLQAWHALSEGAGGVVFDDWPALLANAAALDAAAAFAAATSRNATLYAPLRPVASSPSERRVRSVGAPGAVSARLLESPEALVLIALNQGPTPHPVVLSFSADVPEAIWQNMLGGGAVSFVAGPDGPSYERTFGPHEVLVLMIRKGRR